MINTVSNVMMNQEAVAEPVSEPLQPNHHTYLGEEAQLNESQGSSVFRSAVGAVCVGVGAVTTAMSYIDPDDVLVPQGYDEYSSGTFDFEAMTQSTDLAGKASTVYEEAESDSYADFIFQCESIPENYCSDLSSITPFEQSQFEMHEDFQEDLDSTIFGDLNQEFTLESGEHSNIYLV